MLVSQLESSVNEVERSIDLLFKQEQSIEFRYSKKKKKMERKKLSNDDESNGGMNNE